MIYSIDAATLNWLSSLEKLNSNDNKIRALDSAPFKGLSSLGQSVLSFNQIDANTFTKLSSLWSLSLNNNQNGFDQIRWFEVSSRAMASE